MVRRRDYDGLGSKRIEVLDEAVHHSLQFAEFLSIAPKFCNGIKFVEEEDARRSGREIEKRADVFGCTSEKGGDQPVETGNIQLQAKFLGDVPRKSALSRSRRPVHEQADRGRVGLRMTLGDAQKFIDGVPLLLREYDWRFGQSLDVNALDERKPALSVNRQRFGERGSRWPELLIIFFEHLPQTCRRGFVTRLFKLIRKESRIVTDLVNIETKCPIYDTKHLSHESNIVFHETIMHNGGTPVKKFIASTPTLRNCRNARLSCRRWTIRTLLAA